MGVNRSCAYRRRAITERTATIDAAVFSTRSTFMIELRIGGIQRKSTRSLSRRILLPVCLISHEVQTRRRAGFNTESIEFPFAGLPNMFAEAHIISVIMTVGVAAPRG